MIIGTGGNAFEQEREQWDDGNNVVALEPGVVVGYDPAYQHAAPPRGHRSRHHREPGTWPRPRRRSLHDLPILRDPAY